MTGGNVSVVIPTCGEGDRLLVCLRSIARQTITPGEVLVADDGSPDDVEGMVATVAGEQPNVRFRVVPGSAGTGSGAARNRGIAVASGEWIAACDADDVWLPTKLARQLAFIDAWEGRRRLAAVGAWGRIVNDQLEPVSDAPMGPSTEEEAEAIIGRGGLLFVLHTSMVFRTEDVTAVGGYSDDYLACEDVHLWSRLARLGTVVCLPEPLVLYRKRPGSVQIRDFAAQEAALDRLALNERRRVDGLVPLDAADHAALLATEPLSARARRRLRVTGKRAYRLGAMQAVNGHRWRGTARLALALLLDPARVRMGVAGVRTARRQR